MKTMESTELYEEFKETCSGKKNADFFSKVLASWRIGIGTLTNYAGMSEENFKIMKSAYFEGMLIPDEAPSGLKSDSRRTQEWTDLYNLFIEHRNGDDPSEVWVAEIISTACMGNDHLWQDTGLWSRKDLSEILSGNFHTLFAKNTKDMKWKKFFYKQLCDKEEVNVCRAPSCEVCNDFSICFGPEE